MRVEQMVYVRYQAVAANRRGARPGIFALANGLAVDHRLSAVDRMGWRTANDRMNAAYRDPSRSDPTIFDRSLNPGAHSWFKESAVHLLAEADTYLELLDRYDVACERLVSTDPGRVIYEDDVQIVVVPHSR